MASPKKPKPPYCPELTVDAWTLRCLYNRSDYAQKIQTNEFVELLREESKPRANGNKTVQVYYGLAAGRVLMLRLQWFEDQNGAVLASGFKDPKQFVSEADAFDYHMHGGNRWWQRVRREPEKAMPGKALKKIYGAWRRYKCRLFGPTEARRRALLFRWTARA